MPTYDGNQKALALYWKWSSIAVRFADIIFFNAHLWRANIQPLFLAAELTSFFRCPPMKGGSFSPFPLRSNNRILIHRERDLAY
jgi:hypothetical protein